MIYYARGIQKFGRELGLDVSSHVDILKAVEKKPQQKQGAKN
jgi:hypothetical protein